MRVDPIDGGERAGGGAGVHSGGGVWRVGRGRGRGTWAAASEMGRERGRMREKGGGGAREVGRRDGRTDGQTTDRQRDGGTEGRRDGGKEGRSDRGRKKEGGRDAPAACQELRRHEGGCPHLRHRKRARCGSLSLSRLPVSAVPLLRHEDCLCPAAPLFPIPCLSVVCVCPSLSLFVPLLPLATVGN